MVKDRALTGAAGEYYVAFRLVAEGFAVGLTPRGMRSIDLVVANPDSGKSITIQTKTMRNAFVASRAYWNWRFGIRRPQPHDTFFYAFVDLKNDPAETPDVFIVPSAYLTPLLNEWKGKESGRVTDVWCVIEEKDAPKYRNAWDVIKDALT